MEDWLYWVTVAFTELVHDLQSWLKFTFWWDYEQREYYWWKIGLDLRVIGEELWKIVQIAYNKVTDWAKDRYDWFRSQIGPLWDSFVAVWARFGAAFLDGSWTVVSWVEDKVTAVVQWVLSTYEDARKWATDAWAWVSTKGSSVWSWISTKSAEVWNWINTKAGSVWDWISTKAGTVWTWITGVGPKVESWYDEQHDWLSDLFENKRTELAAFLDDPGRYIADWVVDLLEYIFAEFVFRFW